MRNGGYDHAVEGMEGVRLDLEMMQKERRWITGKDRSWKMEKMARLVQGKAKNVSTVHDHRSRRASFWGEQAVQPDPEPDEFYRPPFLRMLSWLRGYGKESFDRAATGRIHSTKSGLSKGPIRTLY